MLRSSTRAVHALTSWAVSAAQAEQHFKRIYGYNYVTLFLVPIKILKFMIPLLCHARILACLVSCLFHTCSHTAVSTMSRRHCCTAVFYKVPSSPNWGANSNWWLLGEGGRVSLLRALPRRTRHVPMNGPTPMHTLEAGNGLSGFKKKKSTWSKHNVFGLKFSNSNLGKSGSLLREKEPMAVHLENRNLSCL